MKHQNYDQIPDVNAASIFLFIRPFPTFIKAGLVFEKSGVGFTVKVVRLQVSSKTKQLSKKLSRAKQDPKLC